MNILYRLTSKLSPPGKSSILLFIIFLILYIVTAPTTVQQGDTGELVTNSYFLRVVHPPGYPLFTLLYHLPVKYFPFITSFTAAAILTSIIAAIAIALLAFSFQSSLAVILASLLASSSYYWKYAVLPDVFALHILFIVIVSLALQYPKLMDKWWYIFLCSLSVLHHHTIIFVFPLYLFSLVNAPNVKKSLYLSLIFGLLSLSGYSVLLLFNPRDMGSWNDLQNIKDVARHFLRSDYGTFKLTSLDETNSSSGYYSFFLSHLVSQFWSLAAFFGYFIYKTPYKLILKNKLLLISFFCFASYCLVFFGLSNISLGASGESIYERFMILPLVLLIIMALYLTINSPLRVPKWIYYLLAINIGLNGINSFQVNNFRKNTVAQDLTINFLDSVPKGAVAVFYGDFPVFSTYYMQEIMKYRQDVKIIPSYILNYWGPDKIITIWPEIFTNNRSSLLRFINFPKLRVFTNGFNDLISATPLSQNVEGVLYEFIDGEHEPHFNCKDISEYKINYIPTIDDFSHYEFSYFVFLTYGDCFYLRGLQEMKMQDYVKAEKSFSSALKNFNLHLKSHERLCAVLKITAQDEKMNTCINDLNEKLSIVDPKYYVQPK